MRQCTDCPAEIAGHANRKRCDACAGEARLESKRRSDRAKYGLEQAATMESARLKNEAARARQAARRARYGSNDK